MRWGLILSALLSLSLGSYFDNIRGPLLTLFGSLFAIEYAQQAVFLVAGNAGAFAGNFILLRWVARYGERGTAMGMIALTLVVCGGSGLITTFPRLGGYAFFLGAAVAMLGGFAHLLVIQGTDAAHRARIFCGLHTMYGFGSFLGPAAVASLAPQGGLDWVRVLWAGIPAVALLGIALFIETSNPLPLPEEEEAAPRLRDLTRVQCLILFSFAIYVVGEVLTSMWMASFLVNVRGFTLAQASSQLGYFFLAMGITRFACFLRLPPALESTGIVVSLLAAVGFCILGHWGANWAFACMGIFGPFFPLLMGRVNRRFPKQAAELTVWILAFAQVGLAAAHLTLGRLSDFVGIERAFWLPPFFLLLAVVLVLFYFQLERRSVTARLSAPA